VVEEIRERRSRIKGLKASKNSCKGAFSEGGWIPFLSASLVIRALVTLFFSNKPSSSNIFLMIARSISFPGIRVGVLLFWVSTISILWAIASKSFFFCAFSSSSLAFFINPNLGENSDSEVYIS